MLNNAEYCNKKFKIFYGDMIENETTLCGLKSYVANEYFKLSKNGISVCGSRDSIQVLKFSMVGDILGIPVYVFIPSGKDTDMIKRLHETNAIINRVPHGYKSVLNKRSRDFAHENDLLHVQVGMIEDIAFKSVENFFDENIDLSNINSNSRILFPIGSGTSFIGFCRFAKKNNIKNEIIGVKCGMSIDKIMKDNSDTVSDLNIKIIESDMKYSQKFKNDLLLNETYEGKLLQYVENNDILISVDK